VKKLIVTISAVLYLASVTGANLHLHYCMGKLISWKLNQKHPADKCSKCGMTNKKGCCEDQHKFVKVEKDQNIVEATFNLFKTPVTILDNSLYDYCLSYLPGIVTESSYSHAPPDKSNLPIYIYNCVFII
jgi:hypothetical protein